MWINSLCVLIVISAGFTISAQYRGTKPALYFFKPLTVLLIILVALIPKYPVSSFYRYLIVTGLVCSLIGDVFLMWEVDLFIYGLISFFIAHVFYASAFLSEGGRVVSYWLALPLVVYGGLMLRLLWHGLGKIKVPVILYMLVLLLMAWMALSRYLITKQSGSLLAAAGVILFVASDSILATDKFKRKFRIAQFLILTTYFAAQGLIALST